MKRFFTYMPQSLSLGNGNLSVNFDSQLQMRDFYFPYVGQENHIEFGECNRVGVFIDDHFSWLSEDKNWVFDIRYDTDSLVGNSVAENAHLQVRLRFEDFVYTTSNIFFRKVSVTNMSERDREVRLYFHHDFHIYGDKQQETAEFDPDLQGILHYRQSRYFFVGGRWDDGTPLSQFTTGKSDYQGHEGTFRDAEDGELAQNPIEQGSVDSTLGFSAHIISGATTSMFQWVIAGKHYQDICTGNARIHTLTPETILSHTRHYWKQWVQKRPISFACLSDNIQGLFRRSLLLMRTQIDNRGAIIASTDSDIMKFNKDTYTYMWPRDGALIAGILSCAGYSDLSRNFFHFCEGIISEKGFVRHKFTPRGDLGSSWHPQYKDGKKQLPIQEDESALILIALEQFYRDTGSIETVQGFFNSMVLKIGGFLTTFIDKKTGLPLPSYDLWEEQFGVFSYTASVTYAGIQSAAFLSQITGHKSDAERFHSAANKMKKSILKHLFSKTENRFLKKVTLTDGILSERDVTVDASLAFVWQMGLLPADDPRIIATMQAIELHLRVRGQESGICRYTGDWYQRNQEKQYPNTIPGNPWIITTLWLANWKIEMAQSIPDLREQEEVLEQVCAWASSSGILPEQIDPFTGVPLSVAPLTWSHATFVDSVQRFLRRYSELDSDDDTK